MRRLFLDANLLFTAAHNPAGKAAFVIEESGAGHWIVVTSAFAVVEAQRNVRRKIPHFLDRFESLVGRVELVAQPAEFDCPAPLPEKDRPILAAAIACNATHLLTGDIRHFGALMNDPERTAGVRVQTVAQFLSEFIRDIRGT